MAIKSILAGPNGAIGKINVESGNLKKTKSILAGEDGSIGKISDEILVNEYFQTYAPDFNPLNNLSNTAQYMNRHMMRMRNPHPIDIESGTLLKNPLEMALEQQTKQKLPTEGVPQVYLDAVKRDMLKKVGIDTLSTDTAEVAKLVQSAYDGWQTPEQMDAIKDKIQSVKSRLALLDNYNYNFNDGTMNNQEISDAVKTYDDVVFKWPGLKEKYGEYKSKKEYDKAVEKSENIKKADPKALQSDIDLLQGSYDIIKDTYNNWHIPKVGTIDKETTQKTGVITYYKDEKAEEAAIKARDEWLASRIQRDNTGWAEHNNATPEDIKNKKYHIGDTLDEYAAFIDEKKEEKVAAERYQALNKMASVGDINSENYDKDFEKYIKIASETSYLDIGGVVSAAGSFTYYNDVRLAAIALAEHKGWLTEEEKGVISSKEITTDYEDRDLFNHFTEEEFQLLAYYIGKDIEDFNTSTDKNKGKSCKFPLTEKYIDLMKETLNDRESNRIYDEYLEGNTILEVLYSIPVGLDQFASGIKNVFNFSDDYIPYSVTQMTGAKVREDLGDGFAGVLYDVNQTINNMAPAIAAGVAASYINPALGSWVSSGLIGASSAGNTYQEALNNGLDKSEARTYSTLVGVSEAALSVVLGKLGGNVFEGKLKTLASGIKNGALRFAANFGISAVTEGAEEGLQAILEPQFENIAVGYTKNKFEDTDWGEVAYQTFLGSVTGGTFGAVGAGIDYAKNVSQAVGIYDTAFKKAELLDFALSLPQDSNAYKMAQKYKGGKLSRGKVYNLMTASENYIADQFLQQGEKNNVLEIARATLKKQTGIELSTTEIELLSKSDFGRQVLKGNWKVTAAQQRAKSGVKLTEAEQKLLDTPDSELTAEQRAEKQEVLEKVMEEVVKSSQNTVDTGDTSGIEILSISRKNVKRRHTTQKEQNFIKRVAKALGVKVEFTEITADLLRSYGYDFKDGDILPDGFYDRNTKTVHIGYTVYNPVTFILKHELTHFGEGTAQYKKFVEIVKKSKAFRNWLETQTRAQSKHDVKDLENAYLIKIARERGYKLQKDGVLSESDRNELHCEMIADFVGDCIFSGDIKKLENMLSGLNYKERNIVMRYILDFISYLKKKLAGNKEIVLEISRLEDAFNRMLSEAVDTNKETPTESGRDLQFSVKTFKDGKQFVDVDVDQARFDGLNDNELRREAKKVIKEKFVGKVIGENNKAYVKKDSAEEYAYPSKYMQDSDIIEAKMRASTELDNLVDVGDNYRNEPDGKYGHFHPEATGGFDYYDAIFKVGNRYYYGLVNIMVTNRGKVFKDLTKIEDITNDIIAQYGNNPQGDFVGTSSTDIIDEKPPTVNSKYTQETGNNSKNNLQFSFARVQDEKLISKAEAIEKKLMSEGKGADITRIRVWNKYGIIRDSAGEWIYEIDDSEMEFFHLGNAVTENPEIMELYELENAKRLSKEKGERLNSLRKKYGYSILRSGKLSDFVKHSKLFELFPQLKDINFEVRALDKDMGGYYDKDSNTIALNLKVLIDIQQIESGQKSIKDFDENPYTAAKKTIIHEIQHALQDLEDREHGADVTYWTNRFKEIGKENLQPDIGRVSTPYEAYLKTKGEYEARVVSERLEMAEEQRHGKGSTPWLGWGETISARETVTANSSNASIPTNAEYMSAIKDGDTKQIQKMVDNAAKAHGYSERLYHQTGAEFTEFNTDNEMAGKFDWELPTGIFLKPSNKDIGLKGKKQMELFAKAENPLHFKDRAEAREFWSENIDGYRQAAEEVERIDNEYREKDDDAIMELQSYMRQWKKENHNADKRDIYTDAKYQKLADKESAIMDEWEAKSDRASIKAKRLINDFIAESGYDGIVIEHDADGKNRYTKSYIVFDSSQLKSAEPIVYDDKGNVIQLSERFDQNKKDIRFSVPSVDSYTEEQYNSFGWVRVNNVLQANDIKYITSEIQKIVNGNSRGYVQTKYGDYIIPLGDQYNVLVYTDANAITPHIRKIIEIQSEDKVLLDSIRRDILDANSEKLQMADDYVRRIYGAENFVEYKRQNFPSFRGYNQARHERKTGGADSGSSETGNIGGNTVQQNKTTSEAGLKKPAFSMPSETRMLLDMYENGEISKTEYQTALDKYWDDTIAELGDSAWAEQLRLIKYSAKLHGRIKRQNEQLARRRSEISQEITAQREERATKQKNIEHIRKTVSRIDKMLRTNSNTKHVPEELKAEITQFVSVFVANDRSLFDKKDLRNIYLTYSDALREGAAEGTFTGLDEDVLRDLKILRDQLDGKTLRDLNYHETLLVRNIVDNFAQIIKWGNELFLAGKEYEYNEIGHRAMYELIDKKSKRENSFSKAIDSGVVYANMTPAYFFDELGGVFKTLFDDVVEAQNKWYRNVENAKTYIRQMKEKYHYSEWKNDMFEFTTEKGDKIRISREQAMLLYATAKREYGNDIQKAEHLFRGGVVIEPSPKKLKDIVKKFKASDEKGRKRIAETFSDVVDSGAHRITPQDVLKVKRWLSAEQLEYADALVDYLSKDMAALGNETSLLLYGIRKYNEDYYIPYNSAQNFLYSQPGVSNEARLKHQSFTKNTVEGANNPLVLSDFSDVCADHINRMCMYNALTIPLENMNRIFNYGISGEEVNTKNIKSEIERVYGEAAVSYIKTFIEDMNGNVRISQTDKAINRWISKFKKGAVFASASVVVQQPSSIIRAMAYIKPKYFTKTTLKFAERDYQQCVKYAPVAGIKEMGRFDTGVGAATTNWLLQETPHGIKNKVKALFIKDSTYRDDKMSYFAAKADEITWAHIWAAVKAEIADITDLTVGSEKFFEACGKRFTEVINYTQVYDSTLSRSQMMRSKSTGAQMLTAFMSEPTVSLNLLMNAVRKAQDGTKEGKRYAVSAVAAFVGSVALNAFLKSFVTAARDDDEEETYLEKYTGEFISNFLSDVNPLSLIPFVKDVISIFEGYTVERADMNLFSDLADAFETFFSDTKSGYEKFESIAGSLAAFLGLPVKNVLRDLRAVYNLCNDIFVTDKVDRAVNEEVEGYMDELSDNETYEALDEEDKEKLEKNINKTVRTVHEADQSKQDVFDELYAELRKSQKAYNKRRKELLEKGYTADEITDGVEIARIAYMKSIGVDVGDYLLYKIATSKKYADTDNSGGVTKKEKQDAVREMDIDQKIKNYFLNQHK